MKGHSILKVNEATMMAALQMYLDSKLAPEARDQEVTGVTKVYNDDNFEIALSTREVSP